MARPLYMTRDVWPNYICCVLTVREELIQTDRALVQQLVNYVMGSSVAGRLASQQVPGRRYRGGAEFL